MRWQNLKENKCPQCNKNLIHQYNPAIRMFECVCGFKIGGNKFREIVSSQVNKEIKDEFEER